MNLRARVVPFLCGLLIVLTVVMQAAAAVSGDPPVGDQADRASLPGPPHTVAQALPQSYALSVANGAYHTCAVTPSGGVKCWGNNDRGQLGDNTITSRLAPVDVIGLSSGVHAIAAGYMHTCALMETGGVKCWGYNRYGQLGNGDMKGRRKPVDVIGLQSRVIALIAGGFHTCALIQGGGVKCWGYNQFGQVGDGTHKDRALPVDVAQLSSGVLAMTGGRLHTCALKGNGEASCWGANSAGQLGDGTQVDRRTPIKVVGLDAPLSAIQAGFLHTCALTTLGGVKCWGKNDSGQLGDGTLLDRLQPVNVTGLQSEAISIATGELHTCALIANGGLQCWGANDFGRLGDNTFTDSALPVDVVGLNEKISAVTAGVNHTCGMTSSGGLRCWGANDYGQLGTGTALSRPLPADVLGLPEEMTEVAAGSVHTCAMTSSGAIDCWGANSYGQLGDGSRTMRLLPVGVSGLSSQVSRLAAGGTHTCALTDQGGVQCWGNNWSGQLGDGTDTDSLVPVGVAGLSSGVQNLAAGTSHTCAVTAGGGVKCWGHNWSGQLGDGTGQNRTTPVDVLGLSSGVRLVTAGGYHTCALLESGGVKCWGGNYAGQLGDGSTTDRWVPIEVADLSSGVTAIAAGAFHTCAVLESGGVKCWGENIFGQLGDGTTLNRATPGDVLGLWGKAGSIYTGSAHTCAHMRGGRVKCWGDNGYGQLGNGTFNQASWPVVVDGLSEEVLAVVAGHSHTCALIATGGVKCWGYATHGQLGDGVASLYPFPVGVLGFEGQGNMRILLPLVLR